MAQRVDNRRIRVLQVIGSMHIGGAENAVVHLAEGLDRSRFDVAVCCTREMGVLAEGLMAESVDVQLAAPPNHQLRYLTPLYLRRAISRFDADVIQTHGTPSLLHAGPLAALRLLPKWVHTFHYGNYPLPDRRQMAGERLFCHHATQLVAVSDAQRRAVIEHHGVKPERIVTIVNGVERNDAPHHPAARLRTRAELGIRADEMVVGCVAVLSIQKGVTHLLKAARQLRDRDSRLRFLIIGGGPLEQSLRDEAEALGIASNVIFTGWRQDAMRLLAALDVFVMSSLWEAMPLALLEAMAVPKPIVVTDVGDNRSIVDDGRCGLVVPPASPDAIAEAVTRLVNDPALALGLAERALRRFNERFTRAHMLREYEALFERLVRPAPGRQGQNRKAS